MRPTPQYIDRSAKALEYLGAFLVPAILSFPMAEMNAILIGAVCCVLTIKLTAGKAPGFVEALLYRLGITMAGLLPRELKRLER